MPIGFKGAVEEPVSGVTIFNGDQGLPPYDSHIGQVIYINVLSFAKITLRLTHWLLFKHNF